MKFFYLLVLALVFAGCDSKNDGPIAKNNPSSLRAIGETDDLTMALSAALDPGASTIHPSKKCPNELNNFIGNMNAECGALRVPEDHRNDNKKFVSVGYMKVPKVYDSNKPLLVLEQGGPGGSSMMLAAMYLMMKPNLAKDFNILAIEQRGTAWTYPVATCADVIDVEIKSLEKTIDPVDAARQILTANQNCLKRTSAQMDISKISTYQIAKDIVFAAKEMGHDVFHYYGVSYGTVVGQYLIKYSEDHLDNVVLDSPAVVGKLWMNDAIANMDSLTQRKFEIFSKKYLNNMGLDDVIRYVQEAAQNFETTPITVPVQFGSQKANVVVDKDFFMDLLFQMLVVYPDDSIAKNLLDAARNVKTNPGQTKLLFGFLLPQLGLVGQNMTSIMYQSIVCREFSFDNLDLAGAVKDWTFMPKLLGEDVKDQYAAGLNLCTLNIPKADEDVILKTPVKSNKKVLVVGGENDHVTSTKYVTEVAADMPHAHTTVFKDASHGVFVSQPCITESITNYLLSPAGDYNNSCL